jgi:hypothetical protein
VEEAKFISRVAQAVWRRSPVLSTVCLAVNNLLYVLVGEELQDQWYVIRVKQQLR